MPKGYWLPQIDVANMEGYKAYMAATPPAHEKYSGVGLVRGGRSEVVEGHARSRIVIREFPTYEAALACYRSPEYQSARVKRLPHSQCDFLIAEGYDGEQPPQSGTAAAAAARKGYWTAQIDIDDLEGYRPYLAALFNHVGRFGARYLVRAGSQEVVEGRARSHVAVLEFPSYEAALACYRAPEYQPIKTLRDGKAGIDLVVVEGHDGPKF